MLFPVLVKLHVAVFLSRHHKVPVNSVIGTVIAERAFDIITMLIIIIITILSQLYFLGNFIYKNIFTLYQDFQTILLL